MISSSLLLPDFLAASNSPEGLIIFIIVAIIVGISKIVAFFKERAAQASEQTSGGDGDMLEDILKRVLKGQKPTNQEHTHKEAEASSHWPPVSPAPVPEPPVPKVSRKKEGEIVFSQQNKQGQKEIPTPLSYLGSPEIEKNVNQMSKCVEQSAREAIAEAYKSAEKGYDDTLKQLEKMNRKMTKSQPQQSVGPFSAPEVNLNSPDAVRNAVLMHEILSSPKGLQ